jgi:hypothetical protein
MQGINLIINRDAAISFHPDGIRIQMETEEAAHVPAFLRCGSHPVGPGAPPAIGQNWPGQGGVYAGLMRGADGNPDYHLVVATDPAGNLANLRWGGYEKDSNAISETDGLANTKAMQADGQEHPVLDVLKSLRADGHQDFYLPARRELSLCFANVRELFETDDWYWSSTQYSADTAWCQDFNNGLQDWSSKNYEGRARAVRRVPA